MQQKIYQIDRTDSAKLIARYTIGFLKLSTINQEEDAKYAGSGVLVSIGNRFGVLTAAHVLDALPKHGSVGIVDFSGQFQKLTVTMQSTERISIGVSPWSKIGPDIAFLLLPIEVVDSLKGKMSFLNLDLANENYTADSKKSSQFFDSVFGVLEEGSKDVRTTIPNHKVKKLEGRVQFGNTVKESEHGGMDFLQFTPDQPINFSRPNSFVGTSGGGLWRTYWGLDENENVQCTTPQLLGIAFYELDEGTDKHCIICHGPKSIHEFIFKKMNSELNSFITP